MFLVFAAVTFSFFFGFRPVKMGTLEVPFHQLTGVSFSLYSSDEIRKLSVKEITNPVSLDALHHATYGGLYDPALGKSTIRC